MGALRETLEPVYSYHLLGRLFNNTNVTLGKQPLFCDANTGSLAKWHLKNEYRNSILMTCHYPDLGGASDWLKQIFLIVWPIRSAVRYPDLVMTHHQYGISALVPQQGSIQDSSWEWVHQLGMAWQRIRKWRRRLLCRQYHIVNFWEYISNNTVDYSAKLTFSRPLILQPYLMFYFNTNTPKVFFICRIQVVLLGRVPTPCTLPLDLPLLTDHFTGKPVVASWNGGCFLMLHWCETMYTNLIRIYLSIYLLILFKCFFYAVFCIQLRVPSLINVPAHIRIHSRRLLIQ